MHSAGMRCISNGPTWPQAAATRTSSFEAEDYWSQNVDQIFVFWGK